MSRKGDDESRKQQIRTAAVGCFVQRGFSGTRLLDIAREAGMSKGGVYFHYRTKEALFWDVLDAQLTQIEARWALSPVADEPADTTLARLVVAHLRTIEDNTNDTRLAHLLLAMAPQDPRYRARLDEGIGVLRALYAQVIHRGGREGVFRAGESDELADLVLAMVQGLAAQAAVDPDAKLTVRPDSVARTALRMLSPPAAAVVAHAGHARQQPALQS